MAEIKRHLAEAEARLGAEEEEATSTLELARAAAHEELGSQRRRRELVDEPASTAGGLFGEDERRKLKEELFGLRR